MTTIVNDGIASPVSMPDGTGFDIERFGYESWAWITGHYDHLILAVIVAVAVFFILSAFKRRLTKLSEKQNDNYNAMSLVLRVVSRTGVFFLLALSLKMVAGLADAPNQLTGIINLIFFVSLVFQTAIWLRALILGLLDNRIKTSGRGQVELQNARDLIRLMVTIALAVIAVVIILDNIGVNVTALVAGLGVGGIAIGLAAQGIFSDLFAALAIIFDKPFRKGDSIMFDGFDGEVEATGLKTTHLRSVTGEQVIISNTNLLDKELRNMTRLHKRRIRFPIGVIYQTTPEQLDAIPDIFKEIVEELGYHYVRCGFTGFGDSSLNFRMEFEILSGKWAEVFHGRHAVGLAIVKRFAEKGIEFAYPTQMNFTAAPDGSATMPFMGEENMDSSDK